MLVSMIILSRRKTVPTGPYPAGMLQPLLRSQRHCGQRFQGVITPLPYLKVGLKESTRVGVKKEVEKERNDEFKDSPMDIMGL